MQYGIVSPVHALIHIRAALQKHLNDFDMLPFFFAYNSFILGWSTTEPCVLTVLLCTYATTYRRILGVQ